MIKVVYMATPDIAVKSLSELYNNSDIEVVAVITQPDRPKGRGNKLTPTPVKVFASENNITVFQTERISKDKELIEKLKALKPDFFVTFAFGQILSREVLDIPKFHTVNLHASLLPVYRGANPIQRCIYNGDKKTGITTMITVEELDAGDICEKCEIDISENMTNVELENIISEKSPNLLYSTLKGLYEGKIIPVKQPEEGVCFAPKFIKSDGLIDWNKSSADIHNQIRSMVDFPTAYTYLNGKTIKILTSRQCDTNARNCAPGEIVCCDKSGITVNTGNGCICITEVKPESKNKMSAFDFSNGMQLKPGRIFGE